MKGSLFLTSDEFWERFGSTETGTLEFKEGLIKAARLQDPVVAFSNARGGRIVLGVAEGPPFAIVGVPWDQKTEERIQEVARITHPPVPLTPEPVQVEGLSVVVIEVPAASSGWVQTMGGFSSAPGQPTVSWLGTSSRDS